MRLITPLAYRCSFWATTSTPCRASSGRFCLQSWWRVSATIPEQVEENLLICRSTRHRRAAKPVERRQRLRLPPGLLDRLLHPHPPHRRQVLPAPRGLQPHRLGQAGQAAVGRCGCLVLAVGVSGWRGKFGQGSCVFRTKTDVWIAPWCGADLVCRAYCCEFRQVWGRLRGVYECGDYDCCLFPRAGAGEEVYWTVRMAYAVARLSLVMQIT